MLIGGRAFAVSSDGSRAERGVMPVSIVWGQRAGVASHRIRVRACGEVKDLMGDQVVVMKVVDAVAPLGGQPFCWKRASNRGRRIAARWLDDPLIEQNRQMGVVRHPAIRIEHESFRRDPGERGQSSGLRGCRHYIRHIKCKDGSEASAIDLELMLLATRGCSTCRTACGCTTSGPNSRHQVVCIWYTR